MIKLSYNDALKIQAEQFEFYKEHLTPEKLEKLKAKPLPPEYDPDEEISIFIINELVPRGGDIEYLIYGKVQPA